MKKYIVIALAAVLSLSACQDFLVKEPIMSQSTELTLSTFNGLDKSVAGAYGILADGAWYGAFFVLNSEMRAGNAMIPINTEFTSGRMTVPYTMNYSESSTEGLWGYAYYLISAVNNVLNVIDTKGSEFLSVDVEQQDLDNLKAEALALRALAHFDALRLYGFIGKEGTTVEGEDPTQFGVPIITEPQTPTMMPARATVAEVFTQVIADLTAAEGLMADNYKRAGVADAKAAINKSAIQALLARVYLYNKDYDNAITYATKLIGNPAYKLWTATEYPEVWGAATGGSEVIFEVYGKQANDYDEYWEGPSHMTNPGGYADCAATDDLVNLFEAGDVRGSKGIRGTDDGKVLFCTDADGASGGQLWTMKYYGKGEGNVTSTPDVNNVIVLRLSEMYLIRAEAYARSNNNAGALADVNAIRANRGASALGAVGADLVLKERRLELNFEGHYWFDLARTGGSVSFNATNLTEPRNIPSDSKYWALPIPKSQIDVDVNLVQNPGYIN